MPTKTRKPPYSRTRETTLGAAVRGLGEVWLRNGQTGTRSSAYMPAVNLRSYSTCYDVVTPGFAQRVSEGEIVNNPFSKVTMEYPSMGDDGYAAHQVVNGYTHTCGMSRDACLSTHGPVQAGSPQRISVDNLIKLAQTAALANVRSASLQGLVTVAEFGKTLRMLLHPLRAVQKSLRKARDDYQRDLDRYGAAVNRFASIKSHRARQKALVSWKRTTDARDAKKRAADAKSSAKIVNRVGFIPDMVLTYNLGIKPLLMDIDAVLRKIPQLEIYERRTSRATKSDKTEWHEFVSLPTKGTSVYNYRMDYSEECVVRAGVMYADVFETSQHYGYRLADVPAALWEIIPFSFVVDYAVNVEQYINALSINCGTKNLAYFTKVVTTVQVSRTLVSISDPVWSYDKHPVGVDSARIEVVSRFPDGFTPSLAHTSMWDQSYRPPAQVQNVLSLLTNFLRSSANRRFR